MVHIPVVSTRGKLAPPPCSGVEGVGWLTSPHSRQALSGMRYVLIRSYSLANTHQWIEDVGHCESVISSHAAATSIAVRSSLAVQGTKAGCCIHHVATRTSVQLISNHLVEAVSPTRRRRLPVYSQQ